MAIIDYNEAMNDVIAHKIKQIRSCKNRVCDLYFGNEADLEMNPMRHDATALNLQRACQAAIDLSTHIVRKQGLKTPRTNDDLLDLMVNSGVLPNSIASSLTKIHRMLRYSQEIDTQTLRNIIETHISDFEELIKSVSHLI